MPSCPSSPLPHPSTLPSRVMNREWCAPAATWSTVQCCNAFTLQSGAAMTRGGGAGGARTDTACWHNAMIIYDLRYADLDMQTPLTCMRVQWSALPGECIVFLKTGDKRDKGKDKDGHSFKAPLLTSSCYCHSCSPTLPSPPSRPPGWQQPVLCVPLSQCP